MDPMRQTATGPLLHVPERERQELRSLVEALSRGLGSLSQSNESNERLLASWRQLVAMLALTPPPRQRECPICRASGMAAATRCGFCWARLLPEELEREIP